MKIVRYSANRHAKLRLFCLPYAGGGISIFQDWPNHLPPTVEVCSVELPGRDSLIGSPPFEELAPLVEDLTGALGPHLDMPFALFGHSMGGLIAFELARALRRQREAAPELIFISGHRAAHLPDPLDPIHHLPDEQFITELQRLQGTPAEVLENQELLALFLPLLRADFALCSSYQYREEARLASPIVGFAGKNDREVSPEEMAAWSDHTLHFKLYQFAGGHFFLHTAGPSLFAAINQELSWVMLKR